MPIDKATGEFSANVKGSHSLNCEVGALLLVREGGKALHLLPRLAVDG